MLRDTIQGLETERAELGAEIKAAMLQRARAACELYRARLQGQPESHLCRGPFPGGLPRLEVSQVVNKRVRELVEAGDLDGQHLEAIGQVEERRTLYLLAKTEWVPSLVGMQESVKVIPGGIGVTIRQAFSTRLLAPDPPGRDSDSDQCHEQCQQESP